MHDNFYVSGGGAQTKFLSASGERDYEYQGMHPTIITGLYWEYNGQLGVREKSIKHNTETITIDGVDKTIVTGFNYTDGATNAAMSSSITPTNFYDTVIAL